MNQLKRMLITTILLTSSHLAVIPMMRSLIEKAERLSKGSCKTRGKQRRSMDMLLMKNVHLCKQIYLKLILSFVYKCFMPKILQYISEKELLLQLILNKLNMDLQRKCRKVSQKYLQEKQTIGLKRIQLQGQRMNEEGSNTIPKCSKMVRYAGIKEFKSS